MRDWKNFGAVALALFAVPTAAQAQSSPPADQASTSPVSDIAKPSAVHPLPNDKQAIEQAISQYRFDEQMIERAEHSGDYTRIDAYGAVGGIDAKPSEAPWAVEIYSTGRLTDAMREQDHLEETTNVKDSMFADKRPDWDLRHRCGGSLIARDWVLTAGHCVPDAPPWVVNKEAYFLANRRVRLGALSIADGSGEDCAILSEHVHPGKGVADVALLRIDRNNCRHSGNANPNSTAPQPIRIASAKYGDVSFIHTGAWFNMFGWGMTRAREPRAISVLTTNRIAKNATADDIAKFLDPNARILQKISLGYVSPAECAKVPFNRPFVAQGLLCAGVPSGKQDACNGDSGGPLVLYRPILRDHLIIYPGEPVLVGVVKGGQGCAQANTPGLYEFAPAYSDWIVNTISQSDKQAALTVLAPPDWALPQRTQ